jgi:hypothetical protein
MLSGHSMVCGRRSEHAEFIEVATPILRRVFPYGSQNLAALVRLDNSQAQKRDPKDTTDTENARASGILGESRLGINRVESLSQSANEALSDDSQRTIT